MASRYKSPGRPRAPATIPAPRQLYAHVHGQFDLSCPACGSLDRVPARRGTVRKDARPTTRPGYDPARAIWRCRRCGRAYYVGVVLWPVGTTPATPEDHVPGVRELAQLHGWAAGEAAPKGASGRRVVNVIGPEEDSYGEAGTETDT